MRRTTSPIRGRLDRAGILLSGLCAVHCVAGILLVGVLGLGGQFLLAPAIHEIGLALAVLFGAFSLGFGVLRHGRLAPLALGGVGLALMAMALFVGHGLHEALLTICGVVLVATAHLTNLRGHAAH
ncbi:MerC domain-containing protein [Novosphingobium profundi]|uniref:MerC domain-containing protein n=1 Tax=Novosphingobium profundi TaxID=1774954 RepID=UPI001BD9B34D|nr:MerC domain-containing protein [Novosphingobium profundi]MBT0668896.1 MerC domain-containing protein [Novosphingobium profundi]